MTETTTAQTMAVLAELVLMATRHNLPMPMYLTASEKSSQLNLTLNNRADLDAWHAVFGGGRLWECEPTASSPSVLVTNMHGGSLLGWSVNLQASIQPPLSPEVLAALGEAARSDAATLVAEAVAVLDEPKARRWQDRDGQFWSVGSDELISLETERGPSRLFVLATVEELAELYGPLVEVIPCTTCNDSGWIHQEGQVGVPGSGCTHGCPDCDLGRARLARGELREVES